MKLASHPLSLRQLQYAVAVDETRNFRRAAELCHVSQPSLSAQLAQLEDALGVRLFERARRPVLPTVAGKELLSRARRVLLEADDLLEAARRLGDPLSGTLRLGVIPTVSPYLLPEIVPALKSAFPRLNVRWTEDKTETLIAMLNRGELDAALLALEADLGEVESAEIARDGFVLAAPVTHPLAKSQRPVALDALAGEQVLLLDDGHCLRDQALSYCADAGLQELGFRATSLPTLVQMVASGAGVTLLPALAVPAERQRGDIAIRQLARPVPYRTIALAWRLRSPLGGALQQLAATLRESYPAMHGADEKPEDKPGRGRSPRLQS